MIIDDTRYHCPAIGSVIQEGLCWEYCMAGHGGPKDAAEELREYVEKSTKYTTVADFQQICASCEHCCWPE